jgi:hypothetical protein
MNIIKFILAVSAAFVAISSGAQLRNDDPDPSPCTSNYLEAAKTKFTELLDATDEIVTISPEEIAEFTAQRSQVQQYCALASLSLQFEISCYTSEHMAEYQPIWQKMINNPGYVKFIIHEQTAFLRSVPATFEKFTRTDNINALFDYIEGDIWLLSVLSNDYTTLERLQVGQKKSHAEILANMKYGRTAQDTKQSLFDVLKCMALQSH